MRPSFGPSDRRMLLVAICAALLGVAAFLTR